LSLGARVIISSPTPTNPYESGNFTWSPTIYSHYAWYTVQALGGPDAGVYYVDHDGYGVQSLQLLGADVVDPNFPMDDTHMAPVLADQSSQAWVLGLKCGTSPFQDYVVNATSRIEGAVFGTCLSVNSTLPI
jgi:rhamnogalacturonan acetylesterase